MKWVKDRTGRFPERPHYEPSEFDQDCEQIVRAFLQKRYGKVEFPIRTEDLSVLVEQWVEDLDMGADLTEEDGEVEGVTEFRAGKKPTIRISELLVNNPRMENRLRTTLTHEFGHVRFHAFMFEASSKPLSLFVSDGEVSPSCSDYFNKCKRESMTGATERDWMEWQAGYACGAFLMPTSALIATVRAFREERRLTYENISSVSEAGVALIETISLAFQTSKDAARVRLSQKRILNDSPVLSKGLF